MTEEQEDFSSLLETLEGVGQGETPRARIRRYVEEFMGTLPEDRRRNPPPLYCSSERSFRLHQSIAFFHWMKAQGKDVKIMISSVSYGKGRLHVWYKDGSADFVSRVYLDSSESSREKVSFFHFQFFDSPEEVTFADFPYNFMEDYDPNFWKSL